MVTHKKNPGKSPNGHWATRVKLDFTAEFEEKGIPFEKTQEDFEQEEMQQLESFFRLNGEKTQLSLKLLAAALNGVRELEPKDDPLSKTVKKFAYRWRANTRMRGASKKSQDSEAPEKAEGMVAGLVVHATSARSARSTPRAPPQLLGPSARSPRAGKAPAQSPRLPVSARRDSVPLNSFGSTEMRVMHTLSNQLHDLWEGMDADDELAQREIFQQGRRPITPGELQAARAPAPLCAHDLPPIFKRSRGQGRDQPQESHYEYFRRRLPDQNARRRDFKQRQVSSARRTLNYRVERACADGAGGRTTLTLPAGSPSETPTAPGGEAPLSARGTRMVSTR